MAKRKGNRASSSPTVQAKPTQPAVLALVFTFIQGERESIFAAVTLKYGHGRDARIIAPTGLEEAETAIAQASQIGVVVVGEKLQHSRVGGSGRFYPQEIAEYFQRARKKTPPIMVRDRVSAQLVSCQV